MRKGDSEHKPQLVVCNFTPLVRDTFNVGTPFDGKWKEVLNSDDEKYGGSGIKNEGTLTTNDFEWHGKNYSLTIKIPPLATIIFELID